MANDFSGDANCKALWKFDNGALEADSIGGNTLSVALGTPTADTSTYKEGDASCEYRNGGTWSYHSIADASLDAGFPIKTGNAGTISVCFWIKFDLTGTQIFFNKYGAFGSYQYRIYLEGAKIRLIIGTGTGNAYEYVDFDTACTTGRWYHCGITLNNSTYAYVIRIWDDTAGDFLDSDKTGNFTGPANMSDANPLYIGSNGTYHLDGRIDELVVFDDVLSTDEIDQIRAGTYGSGGGGGTQFMTGNKYW